jgi:hypothetical protein
LLAGAMAGCAGSVAEDPTGGEAEVDAGGQEPDEPDAATGVVPRADAAAGFIESTFDTDLDGWLAGDAGGTYDQATFLEGEGHPGGTLFLDGSDGGTSNGEPNSWVHRDVDLPQGTLTLKFETRASSDKDGALRVRLVTAANESHDVLGWEVLAGDTWVSRSADLSAFAGQTVRLLFEQGDNDVGQGEMRYVDNIRID